MYIVCTLIAGPPDKADANTPEDIQRQQADLQAKILSLLGSNAVVPSSGTAKTAVHGGSSYDSGKGHDGGGGGGAGYSQQAYSNSGGYATGYGSTSTEGNYGASYGTYDYR